jgi:hypothetical protein
MSENLTLWEKWTSPPAHALKKISGGRLSGKTDISPMWRIHTMTEHLGPCGVGWRYEVSRFWTETGSDGQIAAFSLIHLYVKVDDAWSEPIPGIGGSMFVLNEQRGPYTSDECFKMAMTDALGVAMKALGVAADVYYGAADSKYSAPPPSPQPQPGKEAAKVVQDAWQRLRQLGEGDPFMSPRGLAVIRDTWGVETAEGLKKMKAELVIQGYKDNFSDALSDAMNPAADRVPF